MLHMATARYSGWLLYVSSQSARCTRVARENKSDKSTHYSWGYGTAFETASFYTPDFHVLSTAATAIRSRSPMQAHSSSAHVLYAHRQ